jgi:3-isopropylmalate/(R)-2-methylmalate dehydratase small subunit
MRSGFLRNDINVFIGESFARIFRQNMFNCGMLAIELPPADIEALFKMGPQVEISIDIDKEIVQATGSTKASFPFHLNSFDKELVLAGGWLNYAAQKY